jgi:pyrroloquinoline quinone biosynthesis protein E
VGVTHRCNLTCSMCAIWRLGEEASEARPEEHDRIAGALLEAGVLAVSLGGGEPLVRRDLPEVVAAYARRGLEVRLLTNGLLATAERIEALFQAGLAGVSLSFDSTDPDTFDQICGQAGAFDRAQEAMRLFGHLIPHGRGPLVVNAVVSARNLSDVPDLVPFVEAHGFQVSFLPVELPHAHGPENPFVRDPGDMAIPAARHEEVRRQYGVLLRMKAEGRAIFNSTRFLEMSREHLTGGSPPPRCDAGRLYLSVSPEGQLTACHLGPPLGPAAAGNIVARLAGAERSEGPPRGQPWCRGGCTRPCWHEVSYVFRDPRTLLETSLSHMRLLRRGRVTSA